MMSNKRLQQVFKKLVENHIDYLLITDAHSIDYLLGIMIHPGERFLGLLLSANQSSTLVLNRLFRLNREIDIDQIWYFDTEDSMQLVSSLIKQSNVVIGVDKVLPARFLLPFMQYLPNAKFVNGSMIVDKIRMVKDEFEIEKMKQASNSNDLAIDEVIHLIKEGCSEHDIAEQLPSIYRKYGSEGVSFEPIIAFGANAADGHHSVDNTVIKSGDSIVIDMGCIYQGYCSDMTRTVFYQEVSNKARVVYELVKKANQAAIAMIEPGVLLSDIDKCARDIISEAGYGENFNHRLGHFIGREVHEYGDVSSQFNIAVEEGMIFSIEPGIYIQGEFGVRIEDLVIVTKDGCKSLNTYPKDIIVIK